MHKILVIRLYFILDPLHVSAYISPSSGATLQAAHRIWYMPIRLAVVWLYTYFGMLQGTYNVKLNDEYRVNLSSIP